MSRREDWPQQIAHPDVQFPIPKRPDGLKRLPWGDRREPPSWRVPKYLAAVRLVPCATCPENRPGMIHAHHIRFGAAGRMAGLGRKPPDWFAVPLCGRCHDGLHNHPGGEEDWWWGQAMAPYALRKELFGIWLKCKGAMTAEECVEAMREIRDQFARGAIQELSLRLKRALARKHLLRGYRRVRRRRV